MVAAMPYRVSDEHGYEPWHGAPVRHVLSAWIIALLLLVGAIVSVALDHVVTVSPDPIATYGSALQAEEPSGEDERELTDPQD
jgi:hypothetical protein